MSVTFALESLYDAVVAEFSANAGLDDVVQAFGWTEPARQKNERRRITWTPGDPSNVVGAIGAVKYPGRDPAPVGTLDEAFTVRINCYDAASPTSERAQYHECRLLLDAWFSACKRAQTTNFAVSRLEWTRARNDGSSIGHVQRGAELVATCSIASPIVDSVDDAGTYDTAPEDTVAAVTIAATPSVDQAGTADPVEYAPDELEAPPPEEP